MIGGGVSNNRTGLSLILVELKVETFEGRRGVLGDVVSVNADPTTLCVTRRVGQSRAALDGVVLVVGRRSRDNVLTGDRGESTVTVGAPSGLDAKASTDIIDFGRSFTALASCRKSNPARRPAMMDVDSRVSPPPPSLPLPMHACKLLDFVVPGF